MKDGMRSKKRTGPALGEKRGERGVVIIMTTLAVGVLVPLVGLAIDGGVCYAVKSKLSAAVDAGSLAAARSLHRGLTLAAQADAARNTALQYARANFPEGFWATTNPSFQAVVNETFATKTRTVRTTGEVDVPVYFMRLFGREWVRIRAEGMASRRDVNLVLVLDRSGSMNGNNACEIMKSSARAFVEKFAEGRDALGLITYGMTYRINFPVANNFKTANPSVDTLISQISCSGGTGIPQALAFAYSELRRVNEPGALNLIVFFTDGRPNSIAARHVVKNAWTPAMSGVPELPPSPCQDLAGRNWYRKNSSGQPINSAGQVVNTSVSGWEKLVATDPNWAYWAANSRFPFKGNYYGSRSTNNYLGIYQWQASSMTTLNESAYTGTGSTGCAYRTSGVTQAYRDVAYVPDVDDYGNSTRASGAYPNPYRTPETYPAGPFAGKIRADRMGAVEDAAMNASDHQAMRIRADRDLDIIIYTIGLGGTEPPDETLMQRISNAKQSPIYDPSRPTGLYVFAPTPAQLNDAFSKVASEILRLAE